MLAQVQKGSEGSVKTSGPQDRSLLTLHTGRVRRTGTRTAGGTRARFFFAFWQPFGASAWFGTDRRASVETRPSTATILMILLTSPLSL